MIDELLQYISIIDKPLSYSEIREHFSDTVESTIARNLNKLVELGKISKIKSGKNTWYEIIITQTDIRKHLNEPHFLRKQVGYNKNFLHSYIPNKTSFLGKHKDVLHKAIKQVQKISTVHYQSSKRRIENMLIDISYSSSKLEGNTYSYLDTEVLIKANEIPNGKTQEETQMILNHKNVIQYLLENKHHVNLDKKTFMDVHTLLGKGLLRDDDLGRIRNIGVKIGGSAYTPLDNAHLLLQEAQLFFEKLNAIIDPFEQSLFILAFIPYFQLFLDINKRTSRISANIPFLSHGLPVLSLLQVKERDYINAILGVYELNNTSLLAELFTENYLLNIDRYTI